MNFNEVIMEEKVTKLKEKCDQQQTMIEIL